MILKSRISFFHFFCSNILNLIGNILLVSVLNRFSFLKILFSVMDSILPLSKDHSNIFRLTIHFRFIHFNCLQYLHINYLCLYLLITYNL